MKTQLLALLAICCLALLPGAGLFAQAASGLKPELMLNRYNSAGPGSTKTVVVKNDTLGWIRWRGWTSAQNYASGAEIRAFVSDNPVGSYIPTNLVFKTGKGMPDRMVILDNGFVGINTSSPQYLLDVNGDARITDNLRIGPNGKIAMKENNDKLIINPGKSFTNNVRIESDLEITGALTVLDLNVTHNLTVGNDAAIGHDLAVAHDGSVANNLSVGKNLGVGQAATIGTDLTVNHNAKVTNDLTVSNNATVSKNLTVSQNATITGRLAIGPNNAAGYLGNTQNYDLMVGRGIICQEVRVALRTNWPDYVFGPTYPRRSLSELEQYIRQNNRLPDMPAAATVAKEGVDLGEMNRKLLEKIEELTLYVIDQNKKIEALETKVQALQGTPKGH